jgi:hypothetical protein
MKKLTISIITIAFICPFLTTQAQNNDNMQAMMAYATPGDAHKMLAKSAGTWSATVTFWMQPGAAAMTSKAEATNEMIMGGRYLQSRDKGTVMGQPFEGVGVTGYDNAKKVYVNTWIDNFGTGIMTLTGTWDDASKSITFTGSMVDPVTGKDTPIREVLKIVDDNTQVMSMFYPVDGKDFKSMEITYTRK